MGDRLDGTGWFSAPHAIFESSLSSDCKLILLYLCRCAGTDGKAFPSYRDIAKKCGLSRRHTIDLIGQMKDAGIIEAKMQTRNDGGSTSNLYNLDLSKLPGGVHSVHRGG